MKNVKQCPNCGASLDIDDNATEIKCSHCQKTFLVERKTPTAETASAEVAATDKKPGLLSRYFSLSLNKRFLILFCGAAVLFAIVGLIFGLTMGLEFNWYGYIVGIAIVMCVIFGQYASTKQGYYTDLVFDYVIFAVPLAFLGGVFYYAAFNDWNWGGIGVLGALIGAGIGLVLAKLIYAKFTPKKPKTKLIQMLDLASVFFLMGQAIGRIGCYLDRKSVV